MKQLESIMQKEMTRQEFITTLGFGLASILGFSSVLRLLFGKGQQHQSSAPRGYGASTYGN